MILTPDGSQFHEIEASGAISNADRLGEEAGETIRARAGAEFFASWG